MIPTSKKVLNLTQMQTAAIEAGQSNFLLGAAGTGKSTALRRRLLHLLQMGEPAYTILALVAEPEHSQPFLEDIHQSGIGPNARSLLIDGNRDILEKLGSFR